MLRLLSPETFNVATPNVPELAYKFPAVTLPVTASEVSVPTLVIFG